MPFSNTEFGFAPFPSVPRRGRDTEDLTTLALDSGEILPGAAQRAPAPANRLDDQ